MADNGDQIDENELLPGIYTLPVLAALMELYCDGIRLGLTPQIGAYPILEGWITVREFEGGEGLHHS